MIEVTNEQEQVLISNTDNVKYNAIALRTNSAQCFNGWLGFNLDNPQFNILAGGIYEVTFNANVTSAEVGNFGIALFADGNQLSGTEMDGIISTAGVWKNVSFTKRIRVCPRGNVSLVVKSVPTTSYNGTVTDTQIPTLKNVNVIVERIS